MWRSGFFRYPRNLWNHVHIDTIVIDFLNDSSWFLVEFHLHLYRISSAFI